MPYATVCERDAAIAAFVPIEYWTITADFLAHGTTQPFTAKLMSVDGQEFRHELVHAREVTGSLPR